MAETLTHLWHSCETTDDRITIEDVMFIVMASSDVPDRIETLRTVSWLHWAPSHVVITDRAPPSGHSAAVGGHMNTVVVELPPHLLSSAKASALKTGANAQLVLANVRHLLAAKMVGDGTLPAPKPVKYFFLVDDDTFVNVPVLLSLLHGFDSRHRLAYGHVHAHPGWDPEFKNTSFLSGGAGMLVTKDALHCVSGHLFTPECDFGTHLNDVTLSLCLRRCGTVLVHSALFRPELSRKDIFGAALPAESYVADVGMIVTQHRSVTRDAMHNSTCTVAARFGMLHPACGEGGAGECAPVCNA